MSSNNSNTNPGALALVGSGEYLPVMNETDTFLFDTVRANKDQPRVVIIPTASGQEVDGPSYWTKLGLEHFTQLGFEVASASIIKREDAFNSQNLDILEKADFYYFSGGDPSYLISTLSDSPALEIIRRKHQAGAVMAGCSAGAMAMSAYTTSIRAAMGGKVQWLKGWGIAPKIIVLPHFDRMANFTGSDFMHKIEQNIPEGCRLIGVDEDTALVRTNSINLPFQFNWEVMGRQKVTVFETGNPVKIYHSGESVPL